MNQLIKTILPIILGLPLVYIFYKLTSLKLKYWNLDKTVYTNIFDLFSPKLFLSAKNNYESEINKITIILYVFMVIWGLGLVMMFKYH
jgi:hypothetical protein